MSNTERQRKFRKNHPGYFNKYNGRLRAMRIREKAKQAELIALKEAERAAAQAEPLALPTPLTLPVPTVRLALPAPVETLVFPGLQTIEALCVPALHPVNQPTANSRAA